MSAKTEDRSGRVYLVTVALLLLVAPVGSVILEAVAGKQPPDLMLLIGKWFVFWAGGVRLFLAGLRQIIQPAFTARTIFEINDPGALSIVRELGFANVTMGAVGLASLGVPAWLTPAALVGFLYYGLAGIGHVGRQQRNAVENTALVSDLLIAALLAIFLATRLTR
jgi:hypothetical protein